MSEMPSDHGFWETLDLLIGREWRKPLKEDLVQDWVEKVVAKRQLTKTGSDENVTFKSNKEEERSSGYGSESKKEPVKVPMEEAARLVVPPSVECMYVVALKV